MWLKINLTSILLTLALCYVEAYGQSDSIQNRYFVIELNRHRITEEPATSHPKPKREDQQLLFAIKTNLLFNALTVINLEAEIPIKNRWSVAGELLFPWWSMDNHKADSRRNRLQLINGNIEGKYWWGDRADKSILTGWFTGLYTGVGSYDFEHHAQGYQGDSFFNVGASGGYAHTINRKGDLRLEYSLGVGYLTTYYHYYEAEFCYNEYWHAVEKRKGRYNWFGPTRAKVSLSWLINYNIKRR